MTRFWKFFIVFGKGLGSFECMFDGKCLPQKMLLGDGGSHMYLGFNGVFQF